jgi:Domain of unknown function (DUF4135)
MTSARQVAADTLVEHVTAVAAALPERARAAWLVRRATPASVVEDRLQRWRQHAAGGEQAAFDELCRARGIDDPRSWVADVATVHGARLPGWTGALRSFLGMASAGPSDQDRMAVTEHTAAGFAAIAGLMPVPVAKGSGAGALAPAVTLLRRALRAHRGPSRALADDLCRHFAGLLVSTFADLITKEGFPDGPDVPGGWADLLHEYPAAGRCLGSLLEGYLGYAAELCGRLDRDAEALGMLARIPPGEPVRAAGCQPGAGDLHNGLRSVTIVELDGGSRVVYKPKDLWHVDALARIADASGSRLSLARRLLRPGYGWEEFVAAVQPTGAGERRSAARQVGAWAFLFHLLGATDILGENVRICAGRVVPIDVETLFRFSFVDPPGEAWLSPAGTGLFSVPQLRDAAVRVADVGLMSGPGWALLDHSEDVVAGYARAAARAAGRKTAVAPQIARAGDIPVRAILRNTWVYDWLRAGSLRAEALSDGINRDLVLERLWGGHLRMGAPAALVAAEVAAVRRLDVPLFTCSPGGTELRAAEPGRPGEDAAAAAALFEPPFARALARIAALDHPAPADLDALRAAMFCAAENGRSRGVGGTAGANRPPRLDSGRAAPDLAGPDLAGPDWAGHAASAAVQSANWLLSGGPGGAPLSAGLTYVSGNDAVVLAGQRPFDLFSGIAGMAVALRSLARRSGDGLVGEAAEAAETEAARAARLFADDLCQRVETGRPPRMAGAYEGVAALAALAASTGTGIEPLQRCDEAIARVDLGQSSQPLAVQSLGGVAGALGFAAAARIPGTTAARDQAISALRRAADRASGSARFSSSLGMLVPSERALAAWALRGWALREADSSALDGRTVAGSGDRLVAAALDPHALQPAEPDALRDLDTLGVLAELEVSLVGARQADGFALAAEAAGRTLLARHDAAGRWFGDSLSPDRFRLSAVWGIIAVAHLLMGLAEPARFSSIRLFEPVPS